ncbi:hypothetical protein FI667_g14795, partial [Globisporangium splendens]
MHIASSVRQKSSAVALSLVKLTRKHSHEDKDRSSDATVELLLETLLGLSEQPNNSNNFCWQQKEGRLLSIDLLVNFLGKDLMFGKYGMKLLNSVAQQHELRKESRISGKKEDQWANACSSLATWTVNDDGMLDLNATTSGGDVLGNGQPKSTPSLVDLLNEFAGKKTKTKGKSAASEFWHRVLIGWLPQTRHAFASNQFELHRISRQILPGLLRLSIWLNQHELIEFDKGNSEQVDVSWLWSCLRHVLLHLRFRQESLGTQSAESTDVLTHEATQVGLKCAWKSLDALMTRFDSSLGSCVAAADTEVTIVIAEAQLMAFLMFVQSSDKVDLVATLLEKSLGIVHQNLPADMQLTDRRLQKKSSDSSLDCHLSISLVRILPSVVIAFRRLVASLRAVNDQAKHDFLGNRSENCWRILERAALAWLATDGMLRWITVDQREAHTLLLKTLDQLLQFAPQQLDVTFTIIEFDLILNQVKNLMSSSAGSQSKFTASAGTHILSIYLLMWRIASANKEPTNRLCQDLVNFYNQLRRSDQQSSAGKSTPSPKESSDWGDWGQGGNDTEPEGNGRVKASETRMTATVYEHASQSSATDHILLTLMMSWERDELDSMRESVTSSFSVTSTCEAEMRQQQQAFRFALGRPHDGDNGDTSAASECHATTASDSILRQKRQRTEHTVAAATESAAYGFATVQMVELIQDLHDTESHDDTTHYGLFIWPSAMVLAHFVARRRARVVANKVVMEIGCGTGLPGILAAICGKPKAVYLTDRSDAIDIQRNVEVNIRINGIQDVASFLPLDWGQVTGNEHLFDFWWRLDTFPSRVDFENVIATVALIFRCNPKCKLYVTYQLRSITRSIAPLLARWGMEARALDTAPFLPNADSEAGSSDDDPAYDNVYLYEISSSRSHADN